MRPGLLSFLALAGCATPSPAPCPNDYAALRDEQMGMIALGEAVLAEAGERDLDKDEQAIVDAAMAIRESRTRVAEEQDLWIVRRAAALLREANAWDRADDRDCADGDPGLSLYCALRAASLEATGAYEHRRTALQEVRFAIEEAAPGARYPHRLMGFNNDPAHTIGDMLGVLSVAEKRLRTRLAQQQACTL